MVRSKGYKVIKHMISDWWRNNQANIVLFNGSTLHCTNYSRSLTESVTGLEPSIAILTTLIMCRYFVESNAQNKVDEQRSCCTE